MFEGKQPEIKIMKEQLEIKWSHFCLMSFDSTLNAFF